MAEVQDFVHQQTSCALLPNSQRISSAMKVCESRFGVLAKLVDVFTISLNYQSLMQRRLAAMKLCTTRGWYGEGSDSEIPASAQRVHLEFADRSCDDLKEPPCTSNPDHLCWSFIGFRYLHSRVSKESVIHHSSRRKDLVPQRHHIRLWWNSKELVLSHSNTKRVKYDTKVFWAISLLTLSSHSHPKLNSLCRPIANSYE